MLECRQREDISPICPHCTQPVKEVWYRDVAAFFGKRYIYFCSNCLKVLSISHRKGFWMG